MDAKEEERNDGGDAEDEGFETASEGQVSDDEGETGDRHSGSESDEVQKYVFVDGEDENGGSAKENEQGKEKEKEKDDDDGGRVRSAGDASTSDEIDEVGKKLVLSVADEEHPKTEEEERQAREQRIADANAAKAEGNSFYAEAKYVEALKCYDLGLTVCPLKDPEDSDVKTIRSVLYSNRAACYFKLQNSDAAVKESTKALELNPNYLKALLWRYQAQEKLTNYEEAIVDVKKVLELDPGNTQARVALRTLPPLAEEKREKLKNEMIGKLKEAGNSILGRFGMSIDNFKTVQDPNTGSYSIQFQR